MDVKLIFDSIAAKLAIDFEYLTSQTHHRQSKGRVREIEIAEEFLRLYLPQRVGIGHGEVIATNGSVSNEADIIFYEAHGCPTLIEKTGYQVFPIECVHGLMEIKSYLDGNELEDAFKKINKIKVFPKVAYEAQTGDIARCSNLYGKQWDYFPTVGLLFAYDSMNLCTIRDRLNELHAGVPIHQRIDFITVLKRGMVVNWQDEGEILSHSPMAKSRVRAIASANPLLLTVIFLQQLFQSAWMPRFQIKRYFGAVEYGRFLDS